MTISTTILRSTLSRTTRTGLVVAIVGAALLGPVAIAAATVDAIPVSFGDDYRTPLHKCALLRQCRATPDGDHGPADGAREQADVESTTELPVGAAAPADVESSLGSATVGSVPPGAVARIRVESIGLDMAIFPGGQDVIDQGRAAWFDGRDRGWPAPSSPTEPGAFWVAGHHSTHGAPFARVDEITIGELVDIVIADGEVLTFEIVRSYLGDDTPPLDVILGADQSVPTLTLQTSQPNDTRLVLNGALVTTT